MVTLALATASLAGCGLVRDVELELPGFDAPPFLECYLTPGEPYRLLLTRTASIFDTIDADTARFLENLTLDGARVTVEHAGQTVVLDNAYALDERTSQAFNYTARERVPHNYRDSFRLTVELPDGGLIRAATLLLPAVPNDSVLTEYDGARLERGDSLARVRTYFTDPDAGRVNRFHHLLTVGQRGRPAERDFVFADEFNAGLTIGTVSFYRFAPRDTVRVVTAHVDAVFERYLTSLQLSLASNGNPFAQASPVIGNLRGTGSGEGALGIFTSYDYNEEAVAIGP